MARTEITTHLVTARQNCLEQSTQLRSETTADDYEYECSTCQSKFLQRKSLKVHLLKFHSDNNLTTLPKRDLVHVKWHICECGIRYRKKTDFNTHKARCTTINTERRENSFPCAACGTTFLLKRYLQDHLRRTQCHKANPAKTRKKPKQQSTRAKSNAITYFKCGVCNFTFTQKIILDQHLKRAHRGYRMKNDINSKSAKNTSSDKVAKKGAVLCNVCDKLIVPSKLKRHSSFHTMHNLNAKCMTEYQRLPLTRELYLCRFKACPQAFSSLDNTTKHEEIHAGKKPYVCCNCSRRFSKKHRMGKHTRRCLGTITRYSCRYCGKYFVKSLLTRHENIPHVTKYICGHCKKKYPTRNALNQHNSKNHRITKLSARSDNSASSQIVYICKFCYLEFSEKNTLVAHVETCHLLDIAAVSRRSTVSATTKRPLEPARDKQEFLSSNLTVTSSCVPLQIKEPRTINADINNNNIASVQDKQNKSVTSSFIPIQVKKVHPISGDIISIVPVQDNQDFLSSNQSVTYSFAPLQSNEARFISDDIIDIAPLRPSPGALAVANPNPNCGSSEPSFDNLSVLVQRLNEISSTQLSGRSSIHSFTTAAAPIGISDQVSSKKDPPVMSNQHQMFLIQYPAKQIQGPPLTVQMPDKRTVKLAIRVIPQGPENPAVPIPMKLRRVDIEDS